MSQPPVDRMFGVSDRRVPPLSDWSASSPNASAVVSSPPCSSPSSTLSLPGLTGANRLSYPFPPTPPKDYQTPASSVGSSMDLGVDSSTSAAAAAELAAAAAAAMDMHHQASKNAYSSPYGHHGQPHPGH